MTKQETKITHDYICDRCGKPATININTTWRKYNITPDGDFQEADDWAGNESEFWCDDCADEKRI